MFPVGENIFNKILTLANIGGGGGGGGDPLKSILENFLVMFL